MVELSKNYEMFARVYDRIMDDSLYDDWLAFSSRHFLPKTKSVLELACGSGILSQKLAHAGYEVTGFDLSADMLALAKKRASEVDFIQGDMRDLDLPQTFDAVTSYSDSICYLKNLDEVTQVFQRVYGHLNPEGLFIFDVHSIYQMDENYAGFSYHENEEDFAFVWDTYEVELPHAIVHELTFFVRDSADGKFIRRDEVHEERTYEIVDYLDALSMFSDIKVYADWTDHPPHDKSKRWFFVCRK